MSTGEVDMSLSHSPKISTDGLVFAYDQNNVRSFSGPPMTNLTTTLTSSGIGTATGYSATTNNEIITIPTLGPTNVVSVNIQNNYSAYTPNSTNCCPSLFQFGGFDVSGNTTYTYGIVYKVESGYTNANYMYRYEYNGATYVLESGAHTTSKRIHLGDGWWWAWNTFTTNAATTRIVGSSFFYYRYSPYPDKVSVVKVLFAQGDWSNLHPKYWPNVNTTKTNSQVFLDMVGTKTITANSLVYANDGSFSFDGNSSWINSGMDHPSITHFTVECWVKPGGTQTAYAGIVGNHVEPFKGMFCQQQNTTLNNYVWGTGNGSTWGSYSNFTLTTNAWHHLVLVKTATNNYTYINGSLVATAATNGNMVLSGNNIGFGRDYISSPRYFNGSISNGKIYDRPLTNIEVLNNFNALRGRYGI